MYLGSTAYQICLGLKKIEWSTILVHQEILIILILVFEVCFLFIWSSLCVGLLKSPLKILKPHCRLL